VLANKQIHRIVLCGDDLTNTGEILLALKNNGIDENKKVNSPYQCVIEKEIPVEAIQRFRENVEIIDKRRRKGEDKEEYWRSLNDYLKTLPDLPVWGSREIYDRSPPPPPENFPSERTGFIARGKTIGEAWLKILHTITTFGNIKQSQYGEFQQEIINLTSIVTDENPNNISWQPYFTFSPKEFLENYLQTIMSDKLPGSASYGYGNRLRAYFGINQIESMVRQLQKALFTRRAVAVTWDVRQDHLSDDQPCIDLLQAFVQDNKLDLVVYIRSNDMFSAWPQNALALRNVQYEIINKVNSGVLEKIQPGDLIINSASAHIYSRDWEQAQETVDKYFRITRESDPRGNLIIELENGKIKVTHQGPKGEWLGEFYANNAEEAYKIIMKAGIISQTSHALDVGGELRAAYEALKNNWEYNQDQPLEVG
jgi:thymidylate synthase